MLLASAADALDDLIGLVHLQLLRLSWQITPCCACVRVALAARCGEPSLCGPVPAGPAL